MSNCSVAAQTSRRWYIPSHFADIVAGARDGLAMQARYDELSRLSPAELAQLELSRADISRVVARGWSERRI
jgi:hypothetical protein